MTPNFTKLATPTRVDTEEWRLQVRLKLWQERLAAQAAKLSQWQSEMQSLPEIPNSEAASVNLMFAKHALAAALEDLS
ncbi:MAG: hypothetical protein ACYTGX_08335 [Planctomycetota bacterium]|jgi:hypothetical protein